MRKGLLLIVVLCSAVVAFLAFSAYQQQPSTSNTPQTVVREKSSDTQAAIDTSSWRRFTAADGRFSLLLPPELTKQYENAPSESEEPTQTLDGVGGTALTYEAVFTTAEQVSTWTDPLSGQPMAEPLYAFRINEYENIDRLSGDQWATELHQWVNQHSAVEDEQERIRSDVSGFYGVRQWIWWQGNPSAFSSFTQYVHAGNMIWQFDVWVNNDTPTSPQFQQIRETVDALFASIEFTPADQ